MYSSCWVCWVDHFNKCGYIFYFVGGSFYFSIILCLGGIDTLCQLIRVSCGCVNRFVEVFVLHFSKIFPSMYQSTSMWRLIYMFSQPAWIMWHGSMPKVLFLFVYQCTVTSVLWFCGHSPPRVISHMTVWILQFSLYNLSSFFVL